MTSSEAGFGGGFGTDRTDGTGAGATGVTPCRA